MHWIHGKAGDEQFKYLISGCGGVRLICAGTLQEVAAEANAPCFRRYPLVVDERLLPSLTAMQREVQAAYRP